MSTIQERLSPVWDGIVAIDERYAGSYIGTATQNDMEREVNSLTGPLGIRYDYIFSFDGHVTHRFSCEASAETMII